MPLHVTACPRSGRARDRSPNRFSASEPRLPPLGSAGRRSAGVHAAGRGESGSRPRLAVSTHDPEGDIEAMRRSLKSMPTERLALLAVVAGLILLTRAVAGDLEATTVTEAGGTGASFTEPFELAGLQAQAGVASPTFFYGSGYQGFGYYTAPAPQAAPAAAPRAAVSSRSSVGPGARNWSTGRRSPLHRPWMRPM